MKNLVLNRSVSGSVLTATLNRPEALNSLDKALLNELTECFLTVSQDTKTRVLVLTGAGRGFCAGADLVNFDTQQPVHPGDDHRVCVNMKQFFYPMVDAFLACEKPIICAVNGIAAGGGVGLALMGDLVLAAESAAFRLVFGPQLGLIPDLGSSWLVPHLVGRARANGLAMLGDNLPAAKAVEWGLIWEAVPDEDLMQRAHSLAERIAGGAVAAIKGVSRAHDHALTSSFEEQLAYELAVQEQLLAQPEFKEGQRAFVEKRPPDFRNLD